MAEQGSAISDNIHFLVQARDLVRRLTPDQFTHANPPRYTSGIGPHLRHCVDHYLLLLRHWPQGTIDYDQRLRDHQIETHPSAMSAVLLRIQSDLRTITTGDLSTPLQIKMDCGSESLEPFAASSVLRELQFLISHTVHHFALIAMILHDQNLPVPPQFGIAPSTLKHRTRTTPCAQ